MEERERDIERKRERKKEKDRKTRYRLYLVTSRELSHPPGIEFYFTAQTALT